jgi:sigma-B regulation protein RsbU (phosphoserine phosphatase)
LVLLVEDDHATREMYAAAFAHEGFRILQAGTATEALAMCRDPIPDLVVADVMLPGIDGLQLCVRLRERFTPARLPIVIVTGRYSGAEAMARARRAGCQDVLLKPCLPETLISEARRLIAEARSVRERAAAAMRDRATALMATKRRGGPKK